MAKHHGRALFLGAALAGAAGCTDREPAAPGPPDLVPSRPASSAAVRPALPTTLPTWAIDFLAQHWATLPDEVKPVWQRCLDEGTLDVAGTPYTRGVNCRLVQVDDYPRRVVVYVPEAAIDSGAPRPRPAVLMHHGSSGSGEQFLKISGWREQADESGLIAVFPSGLEYRLLENGHRTSKWNDLTLRDEIDLRWTPDDYPAAAPWPADDVGFTRAILDDLAAQLHVDEQRLFASGFSNGGGYVSRLAIELSDRFAAVGAVAGSFGTAQQLVQSIPVMLAFGTVDDRMWANVNAALLDGQTAVGPAFPIPLDPDDLFAYLALAAHRDAWTTSLGLDPVPDRTTRPDHSTVMTFATTTSGGVADDVFVLAALDGVTHQYPRGTGRLLGPNNPHGFDAAREFWAFFARHPKR